MSNKIIGTTDYVLRNTQAEGYYQSFNHNLGLIVFTEDIENAAKLSLEKAMRILDELPEMVRDDWEVYQVVLEMRCSQEPVQIVSKTVEDEFVEAAWAEFRNKLSSGSIRIR